MNAVTVLFRVVDRNPAHVRVRVWAGRNVGARGKSGELVFRADEWDELRHSLSANPFFTLEDVTERAVPA